MSDNRTRPTDEAEVEDLDTFLSAVGLNLDDGEREPDPIWRREWQNMPEFVQEKQRPYATLTVRFETQADLEDFARLTGQRVTQKTKSIWHPFRSHWGGPASGKVYVDGPAVKVDEP